MSTTTVLTNTLLAIDLLLAGLEVKERLEESDIKFVNKLRDAVAEGRDFTDEEVEEYKKAFMTELQEWELRKK